MTSLHPINLCRPSVIQLCQYVLIQLAPDVCCPTVYYKNAITTSTVVVGDLNLAGES
jgi:hypothetical protein